VSKVDLICFHFGITSVSKRHNFSLWLCSAISRR